MKQESLPRNVSLSGMIMPRREQGQKDGVVALSLVVPGDAEYFLELDAGTATLRELVYEQALVFGSLVETGDQQVFRVKRFQMIEESQPDHWDEEI